MSKPPELADELSIAFCGVDENMRITAKFAIDSLEVHSVALAFTVLATCPLYALKAWEYGHEGDALYSTHSYSYRWLWSIAYITGNLPALLLLCGWMVVVALCYVLFSRRSIEFSFFSTLLEQSKHTPRVGSIHSDCSTGFENSNPDDIRGQDTPSKYIFVLCITGNIAAVTLLNALYVFSTFQPMTPGEHLLIQITAAIFKLMYSGAVVRKLMTWLTVSQEDNIRMQLVLSILNQIIIPCLVTAFTSPSCFQSLVIEPDDIVSAYSYDFCRRYFLNEDNTQGECLQYDVADVDVIPMTPPFIYNNLCSSVLLTTYIPVYIFMFSLQIIMSPMTVLVMGGMDYSSMWVQWRRLSHGIVWPARWSKESCTRSVSVTSHSDSGGADSSCIASPDLLFKSDTFQLSIMKHLMVLLTFGFCSPFLGIVLAFSLVSEVSVCLLLVSRFVRHRLGTEDISRVTEVNDHALVALSGVKVRIIRVFQFCFRPILISSSLFFAFIGWDMAGDDSDWRQGSWAPLLVLGALLVTKAGGWCFEIFLWRRGQGGEDGIAMMSVTAARSTDVS